MVAVLTQVRFAVSDSSKRLLHGFLLLPGIAKGKELLNGVPGGRHLEVDKGKKVDSAGSER